MKPPNLQDWSVRLLRSGEEFREGVVDAAGAEVGFAVEGLPKVVHPVAVAVEEFDDGQAVVVGLLSE